MKKKGTFGEGFVLGMQIISVMFVCALLICFIIYIASRDNSLQCSGVLIKATPSNGWLESDFYDFEFSDGTKCRVWNEKKFPIYIGHKIRIKYSPGNTRLLEVEDLGVGE